MSTKLWIELILRWYKYFISNSCAYSQVANKRPAEGHRAVHRHSSYGSAYSGEMGKGQMSPFSLKTLNWIKSLIVTLKSTLKGKLLPSKEYQGIYMSFLQENGHWLVNPGVQGSSIFRRRTGVVGAGLHYWYPWIRDMVTIVVQIFFRLVQ